MTSSHKIVVRIREGLGNQLFCYAAARRIAVKNHAELVIDDVSYFIRNEKYRRSYALHHFSIPARMALPAERFFPGECVRRLIAKARSRWKPFGCRSYLQQELADFDPRLLELRLQGDVYFDGYWQSEAYFSDIEDIIRQDLVMQAPQDEVNREMARRIISSRNAVALHVRWFEPPDVKESIRNVPGAYYRRAVQHAADHLEEPHFFVFSDDMTAAMALLSLPAGSYTTVGHNRGDAMAYADLWLMSLCRHFITANSTFSWWGAWLSSQADKSVITPDPALLDRRNYWRMAGLIPNGWIKM